MISPWLVTARHAPDTGYLAHVADPHLCPTRFSSPQPFLCFMDRIEWRKVIRADEYVPRCKHVVIGE